MGTMTEAETCSDPFLFDPIEGQCVVDAAIDENTDEESASAPFRRASMTARPFWLCPIFKALQEVQY